MREFENAISLDPGFSQAEGHLAGAKLLSQPVESINELEMAWDSALSSEEAKNGLLISTMESVAQGDISRVPGSEPKLAGEEPEVEEVELEVLIQW